MQHIIILEARNKLSISGVEEVLSFDDNEIIMLTSKGNMIIRGSDMKVGNLSVESGDLIVEGQINSLVYQEVGPSGSLWTRLFK
ncbi:sporulation protein YabP [Clostridiaceae bacterium OttesenSCG-928-D20]|nr:sporulation protein YabP [Clostridiaceae bacterium OttesenSCG-928-D20]